MSLAMEREVAAHLSQVEKMADTIRGRHPNERDDLIQEGLIAVWLKLRDGQAPSEKDIERRMRRWLRLRSRQTRDLPVDYDKSLTIGSKEELRDVNAATMAISEREREGRKAAMLEENGDEA